MGSPTGCDSQLTHGRPPPPFRSAEHSVPPLGSRGWLWRGWVSSAGCRSSFALGSSSSKTSGSVASAQCVSYGQSRPGWIHPGCLSLCAQCRPPCSSNGCTSLREGGRQRADTHSYIGMVAPGSGEGGGGICLHILPAQRLCSQPDGAASRYTLHRTSHHPAGGDPILWMGPSGCGCTPRQQCTLGSCLVGELALAFHRL